MTNEPTIWRDEPPSEAGKRYVKGRHSGLVFISEGTLRDPEHYQFGPRVLGAEQTVDLLAKVERLERENAELRALIENNNAVAEMCGLDLPKPEI